MVTETTGETETCMILGKEKYTPTLEWLSFSESARAWEKLAL